MAGNNLHTPLLPPNNTSQSSSHEHPPMPALSITIDNHVGHRSFNHQQSQEHNQSNTENPFGFLGADGFPVPGSFTIDPFRNHTPTIEGVYEWFKILCCLPIALIRLLLFGLALLVGYLATLLALLGWKDKQNPMPRWRCRIMWVTRICARGILFSFGYQWIKRRGRPAPKEMAPIVVSNHVSYIEPIFLFYELFPTIVASESHDSLPVVGTIIRAMQVIYVNRFSSSSRKLAVSEIKGTTTNGRALISFQLGAFIPGYPIQPVAVRYPYVHFDQSWGHISLVKLIFRMFTQFHNFMEVEYLAVIKPLENQDASRFAEMTGHALASALNVVQTSHSYGDLMLLMKAAQAKQAYHISTHNALEFLDKFLSMHPDNSGSVTLDNFLRVLRLKHCSFSEKIFASIDLDKSGKITFKQFLLASSYVLKHPSFQQACEMAFSRASSGAGNNCISEKEFGDSVKLVIPNMNDHEVSELFTVFRH
ncbi:Lysophospholipid acyltransferase lpeat2 [Ancistrocladus abbreviatus]